MMIEDLESRYPMLHVHMCARENLLNQEKEYQDPIIIISFIHDGSCKKLLNDDHEMRKRRRIMRFLRSSEIPNLAKIEAI